MPIIPQLDSLKSQLLTSGLQQRNQALYQVIEQLINALRQGINELSSRVETVESGATVTPDGIATTKILGLPHFREIEEYGEPFNFPGIQGKQGIQGPPGFPGLDGEDGDCCGLWPSMANMFATPTALIGLSAINGFASTPMRSDAAPALSQTIAPTWTGLHTFSYAGDYKTIVLTSSNSVGVGFNLNPTGAGGRSFTFASLANGSSFPTSFAIYDEFTGVFPLLIDSGDKIHVGSGVKPDGPAFKHARVSTGSVALNSASSVTVTWTTAFADANYTVAAIVLDSTAIGASPPDTLQVVKITSKAAGSVVIDVFNGNKTTAITGTLHVIAIHD